MDAPGASKAVHAEEVDELSQQGRAPSPLASEDDEVNMPFKQAIREHRTAVTWSVLMTLSSMMNGFNLAVGGTLLAVPAFCQRYGDYYGEEIGWQISFKWQTAIGIGATAGGLVGTAISGYLLERMGIRWFLVACMVTSAAFNFGLFYAPNVEAITAFSVVGGTPLGAGFMVGPIYASEVCPVSLRGYLTSLTNAIFTLGSLLAAVVMQPLASNPTQWAYKIPYALNWVGVPPMILIAILAPDTPWWLLRRGREADIVKSLRRLTRHISDEQIQHRIAQMKHTNEMEKDSHTESTYKDSLRGNNLSRTIIASLVLSAQGLTGASFAQSPTYFMVQAGISPSSSFALTVGATAIGVVGNFVCWPLMANFGRRILLISGLAGLICVLFLIAILDVAHTNAAIWAQGSLCLVWYGIFATLVAPVSYSIASEISATRVRSQTLAFARGVYALTAFAGGLVSDYTVNPTTVNLKGRTAWIWFGFAVLFLIWSFFRLPETKGRTYEQLDILFEKRVDPRKFKDYHVDTEETAPNERPDAFVPMM